MKAFYSIHSGDRLVTTVPDKPRRAYLLFLEIAKRHDKLLMKESSLSLVHHKRLKGKKAYRMLEEWYL